MRTPLETQTLMRAKRRAWRWECAACPQPALPQHNPSATRAPHRGRPPRSSPRTTAGLPASRRAVYLAVLSCLLPQFLKSYS